MAYAERRGKGPKPWRIKYRLPDGTEASESGFETKAAALIWGRDQEARIREGRWTDPNAGMTMVSEWIDRWLPMQDVGISTQDSREYLIRRFIRPAWGSSPLNSLSTEGIANWENGLPARAGISRRTARDARGLLCTILGDAAAHKPPLIPYNPALRPRNRGRRTGRRLERGQQRAWATPLEVLLTAERAALLSGRDDDFTMILTIAYTGMRWGETIGLERGHVHAGEVHVEWQLREIRSIFHRLPPKDDSYRSPHWQPCLPVDLPPFLAALLARQVMNQPRQPCACACEHGGSGLYVFLGPDGGHHRRSNYARRVFRPACDGRYEPAPSRPARLVIADATAWPGCHVATRPGHGRWLRTAARPRNPDLLRGRPAHLLAVGQARPDTPRPAAQPQDVDGRGRHPRDPRRAAPGPRGTRHARPLHSRLGPHARRPQGRAPGPLGGFPPRPRRYSRVLAGPAARRTPELFSWQGLPTRQSGITNHERRGSNRHRTGPPGTGRQGEDDLPNSSQALERSHPAS
jgi:integrase